MINFFITDGYTINTKIIKFKNLKFILNTNISVCWQTSKIFKCEKLSWLNDLFVHTELESLIFRTDSISLLRREGVDWNRILAVFVYKMLNKFDINLTDESIEFDLREIEVILESSSATCIKSMLMKEAITDGIKKDLEDTLAEHGGNVRIVSINKNTKLVTFELVGSCSLCKADSIMIYLTKLTKSISVDYETCFI